MVLLVVHGNMQTNDTLACVWETITPLRVYEGCMVSWFAMDQVGRSQEIGISASQFLWLSRYILKVTVRCFWETTSMVSCGWTHLNRCIYDLKFIWCASLRLNHLYMNHIIHCIPLRLHALTHTHTQNTHIYGHIHCWIIVPHNKFRKHVILTQLL